MNSSDDFLDKLYEILATLKYNSERRELLEKVLKQFLIEKSVDIDIKRMVVEIYKKDRKFMEEGFKSIENLKKGWFKQEFLLLSNIPEDCIFKYIVGKYAPFSREFKRLYGIDPNALWLFALAISQYMGLRKYELNFEDAVYKFKSKKEYGNPTFIALPSRKYIEA